jgi:SulP family sulfate permease
MKVETETNGPAGGSRVPAVAGRGLARFFPVLAWAPRYRRAEAGRDLLAAVIVTIMLIPQSLAYAMLAGLPPEVGLYASVAPLVLYAIFGTSSALAVGPVAVVSLMTASAVGGVAAVGTPEYAAAAVALALLSGLMLIALGVLRLGFLANFLSHPVIAGFISASGILIAASQLKDLLGIKGSGQTLIELGQSLLPRLTEANLATAAIGFGTLAFLFWVRRGLKPLLARLGVTGRPADLAARLGPVVAVAAGILASWGLDLAGRGVAVVGAVPAGLPPFALPPLDPALWLDLAGAAALISIVGFVESVSVAQTLAAKRRERIEPDQELVALGAANVGAAVSGGYPVTGGFARSVVNFDAGAATPAAGAYTAVGIALATLLLTPLLTALPRATLAATIVVAVLSLVDLSVLKRTWVYSKADFAAVAATMLVTLMVGVEIGVSAGVGVSVALFLYRTSRPHMAVVGQVPGTEHFRNIDRHAVATSPAVLGVRVDESLYFANSRFLEDRIAALVAARPDVRHVVLQCSAVNEIDASALESLEEINRRLADLGVGFHLSEVKGPVMDRLARTDFLDHLGGRVFRSHYDAIAALDPGSLTGEASSEADPDASRRPDGGGSPAGKPVLSVP